MDRAEAKPAGPVTLDFARAVPWAESATGLILRLSGLNGVYARPSTTKVTSGAFTFILETMFARPDGRGGFAGSPYLYHLKESVIGKVPSGPIRVRDKDLATVQTRIASANLGETASKDFVVDLPTPSVLTEFFTPDRPFRPVLAINRKPGEFDAETVIFSEPVQYNLGKPTVERWNVGVFGPRINKSTFVSSYVDGVVGYAVPFHSDRALNHFGVSVQGKTHATLSRNGKVIGESEGSSGTIFGPPGTGPLELSLKTTRVTTLSSEMTYKWTFADAVTEVPLMAVQFAPDLDEHNRAKAGRLVMVPVQVQQKGGPGQGVLKDLRVSASYDDGKSWYPVLVLGKGLSRNAVLLHPKGKGFVSLRAVASDSLGNKVEQTTIHAYELTP
jgi:hypothetical protein